MSKLTSQIEELLTQDALSHSLSKDALERMLMEIKEKTVKIQDLGKYAESLERDVKNYKAIKYDLNGKIDAYKKREEDVSRREKAVKREENANMRNELSLDYEQKRVEDHKEMMALVLRNRVVNEQVLTNVPVVVPGSPPPTTDQYGNQQHGSMPTVETHPSEVTTQTEEK